MSGSETCLHDFEVSKPWPWQTEEKEVVTSSSLTDEDYPILIPTELSKAELIEMSEKHQLCNNGSVLSKNDISKIKTKALIAKLKAHLKSSHPLHKHIASISSLQLTRLQALNEPGESFDTHDLPSVVANFYFKHYFKNPLNSFLQDRSKFCFCLSNVLAAVVGNRNLMLV